MTEESTDERGDIATRFQPENKFWRLRSSHGRKPIFQSPDDLWSAALEYFDYIDDNPEMIAEPVKHQGTSYVMGVPHRRNMSEDGLVGFLDISIQTWHNYKSNPDFLEVTEKICRIIRVHKMDGAISGQFNSNIIARELGLADKSEVKEKKAMEVVIRDYDPAIDGDPHEHFTDSEDKPEGID